MDSNLKVYDLPKDNKLFIPSTVRLKYISNQYETDVSFIEQKGNEYLCYCEENPTKEVEYFTIHPIETLINEFLFTNTPKRYVKCVIQCKNNLYLTVDTYHYLYAGSTLEDALVFIINLENNDCRLFSLNYKYKSKIARLPCGAILSGCYIQQFGKYDYFTIKPFTNINTVNVAMDTPPNVIPTPENHIIYQLCFNKINHAESLSYIKDMGFTAIEIMKDSAGNLEKLARYIQQAHGLGLAIILEIDQLSSENLQLFFKNMKVDGVSYDVTSNVHPSTCKKYTDKSNTCKTLCLKDEKVEVIKALDFEYHPEYGEPLEKILKMIQNDLKYTINLNHNYLGSEDDCQDIALTRSLRYSSFICFFGGKENAYARAKARLAWALNVLVKGNPILRMGNEFYCGEQDEFNFAQKNSSQNMIDMIREVNRIRMQNKCITTKNIQITHEDYQNKIIAFKKWVEGENNTLLVIVNLGNMRFLNKEYCVRTGGQKGKWTELFSSQHLKYERSDKTSDSDYEYFSFILFGETFINMDVPEFSVTIMKLE
ncbi:MAG: alpha amylase C-terminal domain-containing protein [Clostridia bacterium]|nr:alpha amylase C-terminal domain-containing protein [Clostridia bacterium]